MTPVGEATVESAAPDYLLARRIGQARKRNSRSHRRRVERGVVERGVEPAREAVARCWRRSWTEADAAGLVALQPLLDRGRDVSYAEPVAHVDRITIEPGKRSGKPCIRGLRMTVSDVLDYLASGMSEDDLLRDFPDLTREDIRACLAFAADRERRLVAVGGR